VSAEIEMPVWIAGALLGMSQCELELGNSQRAAELAEEALELAAAHDLQHRIKWARHHAIQAHEALGNRERAEELRRQADDLGFTPATE
jgi:tetratricopeptide (TPR) repeat protein